MGQRKATVYICECVCVRAYDRVKEVIRHGLHKDMYKCASVCVCMYLLNTDKSSLPLRAAIPPVAITTAAPRHARTAAHYRAVLVFPHPHLSSRKKRVLHRVKFFFPPPPRLSRFEDRFFMNTITRQTKSNPSYPNHHRRVMPVNIYIYRCAAYTYLRSPLALS